MTNSAQLPEISITTIDFDRLSNLAERASRDASDVAAFLLEELGRANITLNPTTEPRVRMGSYVYFRDADTDVAQRIRLVYPDQSDSRLGHISILTPVGAALIGLSPGQSIKWRDRRGTLKELTVLAVEDARDAPR